MGERKETKKEKKGKKQKSSVGFDDSFLSTQGFACAEPEPESPHRTENVTEDSRKKTKRKKKVAFALSPGPIAIKRPKCASSSSPKESIAPQRGDGGGCSLGTGPSRPHDNDSQCTSDDINSQDLFITQKTFRTSPVESSSGEACGNAPTPPERRLHPSPQGSNTRLHESCSHQRPKETKQQTPVLVHPLLREEEEEEEEEEGLYLTKQISKKEPLQTEVNTNLTREKKVFRPRHVKKIRGVNPFLDDAVVLKSKTKTHSCTSGQPSPSCPLDTPGPSLLPQKSNTSTQTQNFFTAELSSFLNFCLKSPGAVCFEDLKPLDLSLPQRARNQPGWGLSGVDMKHDEEKTSSPPDKMSSNGEDAAGLAPSRSSDMKKEPSGRQQRKVKATPSPQSESDPKSTDTTTSSEDNEATGKLDMTQVRAVQMRLNESFFFKAKGDGRSHRPESPLMKLAQGREMKSRKGH
ncbi:proteoglycan 4 [Hippoglossus hippoglossus]|uniref:proteoglycan 4 n=1 Tax=Hippoglossus hippoglossus TaxID=8267 RepID=UPI00148D8ACE|nr:proteoglycan 4 [Hippoglossus hippoglossus]